MALLPLGASIFGMTLDESWESLPSQKQIDEWLEQAGIAGKELTQTGRRERYVRFCECDFGVAPKHVWN
jgi:hypothetical protein